MNPVFLSSLSHAQSLVKDRYTGNIHRKKGRGREGRHLAGRYDFRSWKKRPLANLIHLVWDAWQFCRSLRSDTVTKEIFKGEETLLILTIHLVSSRRLLWMRFKFFLEIRFWKGEKRRKDRVLSFGAPKENVSCFMWCLTLWRGQYIWTVSNRMPPNNTQRLAQTFNYLLRPGRMDSSFPHLSLISSETLNFCGQDANVVWDQKSYIQSIFIYKGIKYSTVDLSDFYRSLWKDSQEMWN